MYSNNSQKHHSNGFVRAAASSGTEPPKIGHFIVEGLGFESAGASAKSSSNLVEPKSSNDSLKTTENSFYQFTTRVDDGWFTETSKTLRPTGPISWASPMPEVEKCWSDIVTWRDSSIKWWNKYIAETPFPASAMTEQTTILRITETSWETTIYPTSVHDYTLCDGTPRVDARPETRTTTYNMTHSNVQTVPKEYAFPQTQPCIPDPKTCRKWYYDSNINVTNEAELLQLCGKPTGLYEPCLVRGGPVQLIYWPEESGESHVCPNNASLPMRQPSNPSNSSSKTMSETVTALGTTFTSGSVYLSFHTLYASYDGFYDRVGPTFKDTIIPVPSSSMSTHCGGLTEAHGPGTALSYADLNWPVPASAYNCQARCDQAFVALTNRSATPPECKTIWSDVNPNIAIPTMIKDLVPEWSSCEMSGFRIPNFWFDPPVMLTKTDSIAMPSTFNAEPTKEPPAPSLRSTSSGPRETGSPQDPTGRAKESSSQVLPSKLREQEDEPRPTAGHSRESEPPTQASSPEETKQDSAIQYEPPTMDHPEVSTEHEQAEPDSPARTSAPMTYTTQFSYQPVSSSLDALSVLQSALGDLSRSGFHPSVEYTNIPQASDRVPDKTTQDSSYPATSDSQGSSDTTEGEDFELPVVTMISGEPAESHAVTTGDHAEETKDTTTSNYAAFTPPTSDANQISYVGDNGPINTQSHPSKTNTGSWNPSVTDDPTATDDPISSSGGVFTTDDMPSVVVAAPEESNAIHLAVPSLTITANTINGSPGAFSVGGTTLAEEGDIATLESGETLLFEPSGIAVVRGSTTIGMSSIGLDGAATTSASEPSSTSTVSSESAADAGEQAEGIGCRMASNFWAVFMAFVICVLVYS